MVPDKDTLLFAGGAGAIAVWLINRAIVLFRHDRTAQVINKSLLAEIERKDGQLIEKEKTINRLVREKADLMAQLAELPRLRDQISALENRIDDMAHLVGLLFEAGVEGKSLQLSPDHQRELLKIVSRTHTEAA